MARAIVSVNVDTRTLNYRMKGITADLIEAGIRGVQRALIVLQRYIVRNKLSGDPLKTKTGALAASIRASDAVYDRGVISGNVYTDLPYARVHEYGGTITVREHIATSNRGRQFTVRSHSATYPRRAFMSTSLQEARSQIVSTITAELKDGLRERGY